MKSQPGGLFTAVLMLVPLIGVPVAAIVGLPPLPGANAASADELNLTDELKGIESSDGISGADSLDHLFSPASSHPPITHQRSDTSASAAPQVDDPFGIDSKELYTPFSEVTHEIDRGSVIPSSDSAASSVAPNSFSNIQTVETPPWADDVVASSQGRSESVQPSTILTWEQAVARLNALGIRNYRLEEDNVRGGYHFFCVLTPTRQQNVRHRFNATAAQPLDAVADVFAQIERWQTAR